MSDTFEVGQKVRVNEVADGEVTYGPFRSEFGTYTGYVVRLGDTERLQRADSLSPIPEPPKFAIGDKVTGTCVSGEGEIVAGPFMSKWDGCEFWVVADSDGQHSAPSADGLTKVEAPAVKVGDRVRVVRARWAEEQHGKVGEVISTTETWRADRGDPHPYDVRMNGGNRIWVAEVEPVTDENTYVHETLTEERA